jgi:H+/Cl- antiporter ClcA
MSSAPIETDSGKPVAWIAMYTLIGVVTVLGLLALVVVVFFIIRWRRRRLSRTLDIEHRDCKLIACNSSHLYADIF